MKTYTIRTRSTGSDNYASCGKFKASCTCSEREAVRRCAAKIIGRELPADQAGFSCVRPARLGDGGWQPGEWLLKVEES